MFRCIKQGLTLNSFLLTYKPLSSLRFEAAQRQNAAAAGNLELSTSGFCPSAAVMCYAGGI
jgi:hypothetical protein